MQDVIEKLKNNVHRVYDYLGPFAVLWVHMAWYRNCVVKKKRELWKEKNLKQTKKELMKHQ